MPNENSNNQLETLTCPSSAKSKGTEEARCVDQESTKHVLLGKVEQFDEDTISIDQIKEVTTVGYEVQRLP